MRRARDLMLLALVLGLLAGPRAGPLAPTEAEATPLHEVTADGVTALVPRKWDFRPMSDSDARSGILASKNLRRWESLERRLLGLEAYWVDATRIGVPSDYYYLAAEPALRRLPTGTSCKRKSLEVISDRHPQFDRRRNSAGDYVAIARGICKPRERTMRWASFVAAPGFGPVGRLGIPESGLYFALVMVPERKGAEDRAARLLSRISFGGTLVEEFIAAATA